ncbi:MAG: hypothetical protein U0Q16_00085 [Bryobacteraceae bacterium]
MVHLLPQRFHCAIPVAELRRHLRDPPAQVLQSLIAFSHLGGERRRPLAIVAGTEIQFLDRALPGVCLFPRPLQKEPCLGKFLDQPVDVLLSCN